MSSDVEMNSYSFIISHTRSIFIFFLSKFIVIVIFTLTQQQKKKKSISKELANE